MMTRWDKLRDDRGNPSKICTIRNACKESGYAKGFLVNRDETGRFWSAFLITGFLYAGLMHLVLWITITRGSEPFFSPPFIVGFVFSFVFYGGSMGLMVKLYGWRSSKHARQAMLRAGLCPGCGYQLPDVPPDSEGCTVCPECGAAWKLDDADVSEGATP